MSYDDMFGPGEGGKKSLFDTFGLEDPFKSMFPKSYGSNPAMPGGQGSRESQGSQKTLDAGERRRARAADLIIPPAGYTQCGNCEYLRNGNYCVHPKVAQAVRPNWCCVYWDAPGTIRVADL